MRRAFHFACPSSFNSKFATPVFRLIKSVIHCMSYKLKKQTPFSLLNYFFKYENGIEFERMSDLFSNLSDNPCIVD